MKDISQIKLTSNNIKIGKKKKKKKKVVPCNLDRKNLNNWEGKKRQMCMGKSGCQLLKKKNNKVKSKRSIWPTTQKWINTFIPPQN